MLTITKVIISRWRKDQPFDCEITLDFNSGEIELKLDEQRVQRIVDVVADLIVEGGQHVANELKRQALDHKALTHQL